MFTAEQAAQYMIVMSDLRLEEYRMLNYYEATNPEKILAIHYSNRVGDPDLIRFMSGQSGIPSKEMAFRISDGFWQMTDLAADDDKQNKQVEGIDDIEFWMYKLFNKVYGYMKENGFQDEWDRAAGQRNS